MALRPVKADSPLYWWGCGAGTLHDLSTWGRLFVATGPKPPLCAADAWRGESVLFAGGWIEPLGPPATDTPVSFAQWVWLPSTSPRPTAPPQWAISSLGSEDTPLYSYGLVGVDNSSFWRPYFEAWGVRTAIGRLHPFGVWAFVSLGLTSPRAGELIVTAYVNGVLEGRVLVPGALTSPSAKYRYVGIDAPTPWGHPFLGRLDSVMLFNYSLDPTAAKHVYLRGTRH